MTASGNHRVAGAQDTVIRLAGDAPRAGKARLLWRPLLTVVLLGVGGAVLWTRRADVGLLVGRVGWLLPLGVLLVALGGVAGGLAWQRVLRALGTSMDLRTALGIFLTSQVAKYLPTGLGPLAAQFGWARRLRVSGRRMTGSYLLAYALSLAAGTTAGGLLLCVDQPRWGVYPAVTGLVASTLLLTPCGVRLVNRVLARHRWSAVLTIPTGPYLRQAYAWSMGGWVLMGVHLWVLLGSYGLAPRQLIAATGAFIAAATLGSAAFFLPGGLGVREGLLLSYLSAVVNPATGATVVLLARLLTLLVDVLLGVVGVAAVRSPSLSEHPTTMKGRR